MSNEAAKQIFWNEPISDFAIRIGRKWSYLDTLQYVDNSASKLELRFVLMNSQWNVHIIIFLQLAQAHGIQPNLTRIIHICQTLILEVQLEYILNTIQTHYLERYLASRFQQVMEKSLLRVLGIQIETIMDRSSKIEH